MKVGRNDPCPCGSGRKFKKCCLLQQMPFKSDFTNNYLKQVIERISEKNRKEICEVMRQVVREVYASTRNNTKWSKFEYEAERIQLTISELHTVSHRLLQDGAHSRQYWFQLIRWAAPILICELLTLHDEPNKRPNISDNCLPEGWYLEVIQAASQLVLICSGTLDVWEWHESEGIRGIDFSRLSINEIQTIAGIISLAELWNEAKVRFRYACKGFNVFANWGEKDVLETQDTKSIELYENRRSKYDTLTGTVGLWYDPFSISVQKQKFCGWVGLRAVNPGENVFFISAGETTKIKLRYVILPLLEKRTLFDTGSLPPLAVNPPEPISNLPFLIIPYDSIIRNLAESFEVALGCDSIELITFLYAFYRMLSVVLGFGTLDFSNDGHILSKDQNEQYQSSIFHRWSEVGELGLLRSSEQDWIKFLELQSSLISKEDVTIPTLDSKKIKEFISKFSWSQEGPTSPNSPLLFTWLSKHTLAVDLIFVVDFLRYLLLQVNLVGRDEKQQKKKRIGDFTGSWLEDQATEFFIRNLNLKSDYVLRGRKISNLREIDLAFVYCHTLFVIDCKSMAKDEAYIEGQYNKLRNRQSEFRKELQEKCPQRIKLITNGQAADIIDPSTFDHAYGLVCTSSVEYLPLDKTYFWCCGVPLVGPPEELLDTIIKLAKNKCIEKIDYNN